MNALINFVTCLKKFLPFDFFLLCFLPFSCLYLVFPKEKGDQKNKKRLLEENDVLFFCFFEVQNDREVQMALVLKNQN